MRLGHQQVPAQRVSLAAYVQCVHHWCHFFHQYLAGDRGELMNELGVTRLLHGLPVFTHRDGAVGQRGGVLLDQNRQCVKRRNIRAREGQHRKIDAAFIEPLGQRLGHRRFDLLGIQIVEGKVAPVIKNQKFRLVNSGAEQVQAQARAAAYHLPELDLALDRLGKDQINHFGNVDASVEHIHRYGDAQIGLALELIDQFFGARLLRVDHATQLAGELRIHAVEQFRQQPGVGDIARKDDGFSRQLTIGIAYAVVHQVAQNDAVGVQIEHNVIDFLGVEVQIVRIYALVFHLRNLLVVQVGRLDTVTQKLGGVRHHPKWHQVAIGNRLIKWIVSGGQLVITAEYFACAAADHFNRRRCQADLQRIKILEEIAVQIVDGAVRFIGNDEVEETDIEGFIIIDQALVDADVDACI